ncbi:hypothetical protein V1264_007124 [Littorina saxatilis]
MSQTFITLWLLFVVNTTPGEQHDRAIRVDSHPLHNTPLKDAPVVVTVNLQQSLNTITDHFIGHSLGFPNYGVHLAAYLESRKLITIARALSPMWVRMAGNFVSGPPYKMSRGPLWDKMNHFFKTVGWDQIHVLDDDVHGNNGSWSPDKARVLVQYSAARNYSIAGFELGNEYDVQSQHDNTTLTPAELATGVQTLQTLLGEFPKYYSSFITGPDTLFVLPTFFQGFLSAGGQKVVRAATFHHYYFSGLKATLSSFTNITIMQSLAHKIDKAMAESRSVNPLLPVWLSETGSASAQGAPGLSDRFVAGFLWLDKLGVCAKKGIQSVIRFVFYANDQASFGLIDKNLNPNPDFWLTVLYRRIVRGAVFLATGRHDVRVYAACANTDNFKAGGLALYILNPNNYPVTFDLPQFTHQPRFRYSLTAGDKDGLTSKYIALNGEKLQLVNDELPPLEPESAPPGVVTVPAYSYTFLVFPEAEVSICLH